MLVLALAPSSFAQVNIQIFGAPSASEVATVRTAQTADPLSSGAGLTISGSVIANIELTTTILNLTFGGPITGNCPAGGGPGVAGPSGPGEGAPNLITACAGGVGVPAGDPIQIAGASGLFGTAYISTILFSSGIVQIALPNCKGACNTPAGGGPMASGSFRLIGVRLDVNGKTAPITVSATLGNTANGYINSSTPQNVITALGAGVGGLALGTAGTATAFTNGAVTDPTASVVISEGFASAWRANQWPGVTTNTGTTINNAYSMRITVSGIPTNMTLSATTSPAAYAISAFSSATAATRTATITIPATTDLTKAETVTVTFTLGAGTATIPLTPGSITLTTTMMPVGNPTSVNGTAADGYPVFTASEVGPITIANIAPASTTLLVPFAVRDGAFDTGIALANTTADPFGGATLGGATAAPGTVTLTFFPRSATGGAGTSFSLTTSATVKPGIGLTASDGSLAAGATWTVLLSELLTAAGQTGSFTGYIFITTNFTNAHGAPFVSDFRNFTSYTPMLVLPPPITLAGGRSAIAGGEALNN